MESEEGRGEADAPEASDPAVGESGSDAPADATPPSSPQGDVPADQSGELQRLREELDQRGIDPEVKSLIDQLDDPERGAAALDELAARYGYEPNVPDVPEDEIQDEYSHLDPVIAKRLRAADKADEERKSRETQQDREKQVGILKEHVTRGMESLAARSQDENGQNNGLGEAAKKLFTYAALNHPGDKGLPDVAAAEAMIKEVEADAVERFKKGLSGAPPPAVEGSTGVRQPDRSTAAARRRLGEQVAGRHYQQT